MGKTVQRLSHWGTAHLELLGQLTFLQRCSRYEFKGHDSMKKLFVGYAGEVCLQLVYRSFVWYTKI